jgi:hypothetical protein
MEKIYIPLLMVFAAFGAFCFNMGHRRAYRVVFKSLLKGQIAFLSERVAQLNANGDKATADELAKAAISYETIGRLVIGWHKSFAAVRDDKELRALKARIKAELERYLAAIEGARAS